MRIDSNGGVTRTSQPDTQTARFGMNDIGAIVARVGVTPGSMAAVKTPFTMGTYDREGAMIGEQIESDANLKFGLERDLQSALRRNIKHLEKGLRIIDGARRSVWTVFD